MTTVATIARERALNCEAKKHAYRQTQDGVVVSFVLHPQEVPEGLATAPLGTRYVLAMVELNDQDEPKEVMPNTGKQQSASAQQHKTVPASDSTTPAWARKSWDDMPASQQAGILCDDPSFRKFLGENWPEYDGSNAVGIVYILCDIRSRTEILPGTRAEKRWQRLVADYRTWQLAASVVPV